MVCKLLLLLLLLLQLLPHVNTATVTHSQLATASTTAMHHHTVHIYRKCSSSFHCTSWECRINACLARWIYWYMGSQASQSAADNSMVHLAALIMNKFIAACGCSDLHTCYKHTLLLAIMMKFMRRQLKHETLHATKHIRPAVLTCCPMSLII
jgi:hypothetical protein